jgi:hypothetical protein
VQVTDTSVNFVWARVAVAAVLAVCACGCRQVDSFGPVPTSISADSSRSLPTTAPTTSRAQVVEVCRFPGDEGGGSTGSNEFAGGSGPISGNLNQGMETKESLSLAEPADPSRATYTSDAWQKFLAEAGGAPADPPAGQPLFTGPEDDNPKTRLGAILAATQDNVFKDYANYYTVNALGEFAVILAPAAVFANSDLDADVGNWYQQHIRSADTNRASNFIRPLGNGFYTIPVYVSAKFLGEYFDDQPGMALLGEFGDRTSRALLVGAPPFLTLQYLTGGGRPSDIEDESYWRPFRGSHGASGHAFMGAVPFLTLAGMIDDPLAKCFCYACSPWTGMTRINDNVHYLSQVWLGWWMAYLACDAVNQTEKQRRSFVLAPLCSPEMTGVGVIYQH